MQQKRRGEGREAGKSSPRGRDSHGLGEQDTVLGGGVDDDGDTGIADGHGQHGENDEEKQLERGKWAGEGRGDGPGRRHRYGST